MKKEERLVGFNHEADQSIPPYADDHLNLTFKLLLLAGEF